ncbi:YjdF family protein [Mucilaginibacter agri]|uniref:DUF748 domain-containing protein n=1 Tax=Mucilaginibacter agri TaxID=2695265 RepID=A0A966DT28_9SPHI|nr:YjdF family protein [Mucilaginibacter agri]NCD68319.1 hypothetical protein [Mucilaginibacter agri]
MKIKKRSRIVLFVIGTIGFFILMSLLLINTLLAPVLTRKIKSAVIKASNGLYQVNFSSLDLHVLQGKATFKNITLIPDTAVFERQRNDKGKPSFLIKISAGHLSLSGAHLWAYLLHRKLEIGLIALDSPDVALNIYPDRALAKPQKEAKTIYQQIKKSLRLIDVDLIAVDHIRLNYKDYSSSKTETIRLKDMSLRAYDLLIDSATQADTTRTLFCRNIHTDLHNIHGVSAGGLYQYNLRSITYNSQDACLKLAGIILKPLPVTSFFQKSRDDRFSLNLDSVILNHADLETFRLKQMLFVHKITCYNGEFEDFSNPHGLIKKSDRVVTFPNKALRKMSTILAVDTLDIRRFKVSYQEYNKDAGKTGWILFDNISGRFLNITNYKPFLVKNPYCKVITQSYFMGKGKLDLQFSFNLIDIACSFAYKGHLGPMEIPLVNPAVMPLALVEIKTGQVKSLDFNIQSNRRKSTGDVTLLYNNLNIALLNSGVHKKYELSPIKSFVANNLLIKNDNPDNKDQPPRHARILFIRPASYSFFKSLWQTLLSGLKPCVGVGDTQQQAVSHPLAPKEQQALNKANKKALKQKKRADKEHQKQLRKQDHA